MASAGGLRGNPGAGSAGAGAGRQSAAVHNEAEGEIGFNWYDTVKISNNASIEEVQEAIEKAKELIS